MKTTKIISILLMLCALSMLILPVLAQTENLVYNPGVETACSAEVLISSYTAGTSADCLGSIMPSTNDWKSAIGIEFAPSVYANITKVSFQLSNYWSLPAWSGNATAVLYLASGMANPLPIGNALAISNNFTLSVLTSSWTWYNITFSDTNQYPMQNGSQYFIMLEAPSSGTVNSGQSQVNFLYGSPTLNAVAFHWNAWYSQTNGINFQVFGQEQAVGSSPDGWYHEGSGGSSYWSTIAHTGIHSLGENPSNANANWICTQFPLQGNTTYSFSFWVLGNYTSGTFTVFLRYWNGNTWLGQTGIPISGSFATWQNINITVTTGVNVQEGDIRFESDSATGNILLDDFYVGLTSPPAQQSLLDSLLFGDGFWFTIIIILAVIVIAVYIVPYSGILFMILTMFLGFEYLKRLPTNQNYMWGALVMLLSPVYIILMMALFSKRR